MSRYLLDTTALIDVSKRREPARSRIRAMIAMGDEVGVCPVNVAEFFAGLSPEAHPEWEEFFDALHYWDISRAAAVRAGQYRYEYARKGRPLSTADTLVAAVAREIGAAIVTSNPKDFPLPDLELLSVRE